MRDDLHPEVAAALLAHGLRPAPGTPLPLLRGFLNDLYRFEIRQLKGRLRDGAFPLAEYVPRVIALRGRYRLLSRPLVHWTHAPGDGPLR